MSYYSGLKKFEELAKEWRRELHQHPELFFQEHETARRLQGWLKAHCGARDEDFHTIAAPGFYYDLDNGSNAPPSRTIALRADMDALPSTEQTGAAHQSRNSGRHHACGHDGHMASLVYATAVVHSARSQLPDGFRVRVFFQPAEENEGGADPMVKQGLLDGVDEVYGFHNWPAVPAGSLAVRPGPLMAHPAELTITVRGRSGHASMPHVCANPIVAAASMISAIPVTLQNRIDAAEHVVVTFCNIHSGDAANVVPDECRFQGTIRNFDAKVHAQVCDVIRETCKAAADLHRCEVNVDILEQYPPVINHAKETEHVREVAMRVLGKDRLIDMERPILAAEDFSYYLLSRPGCFFFMGSGAADGSASPGLHTSRFDFNDGALLPAAAMFLGILEHRGGFLFQ